MGQRTSTTSRPDNLETVVPCGVSSLPVDVLLMIVDLLDHEGLLQASVLSKDFNRFVNRRLWGTRLIQYSSTLYLTNFIP